MVVVRVVEVVVVVMAGLEDEVVDVVVVVVEVIVVVVVGTAGRLEDEGVELEAATPEDGIIELELDVVIPVVDAYAGGSGGIM